MSEYILICSLSFFPDSTNNPSLITWIFSSSLFPKFRINCLTYLEFSHFIFAAKTFFLHCKSWVKTCSDGNYMVVLITAQVPTRTGQDTMVGHASHHLMYTVPVHSLVVCKSQVSTSTYVPGVRCWYVDERWDGNLLTGCKQNNLVN